jgi:hypothetical protein
MSIRRSLAAAVLASVVVSFAAPAFAAEKKPGDDRLVIVNEKTGRVVYDDGRDDVFCTSKRVPVGYRRVFAGYDYYGNPRYRVVTRYGEVVKRCY